jgi:hypothetical protein
MTYMTRPIAPPRPAVPERLIAALVRHSYDRDLRERIEDSLDRQLARLLSDRPQRHGMIAA